MVRGDVLEFEIDRLLDASWDEGIERGIEIGETRGIEIGKVELLVQMGQSSGQTEQEIVQNVAHFLDTNQAKAQVLYEQYLEGERNSAK